MEPAEILDSARNLERLDYVAQRNYGLEHQPPVGASILHQRDQIFLNRKLRIG